MGIGAALRRLAARAPVPVFPVVGAGARDAVQDLLLEPAVRLVNTPRAATILLVAGHVRRDLLPSVAAVHDIMARPRCTVVYALGNAGDELAASFPRAILVKGKLAEEIVTAHRDLLAGSRASEAPWLPDVDPAPWRDVGPYRQGGSGMTGGVPYGRPLADKADDRDGLTLDQLPLRIGPFAQPLPPGLVLDLKLQGDVVQEAAVPDEWWAAVKSKPSSGNTSRDPFRSALRKPAGIADLELLRARHHVRWLASALHSCGLRAMGLRALGLAARLSPTDGDAIAALERAVRRTGAMTWYSGIGAIDRSALTELGVGPNGRAAGVTEDVRLDDPTYAQLGFELIVHDDGDVPARWRQRIKEAAQSLELVARAEELWSEPTGRIESPHGRLEIESSPSERLLRAIPASLVGLEWGDAVATVVSLDLDVDEIVEAHEGVARVGAR